MTKPKNATADKPEVKLTQFRVHFRKSDDDERRTMVVGAQSIGGAHDAVREAHQTDDVRVFIDKTKVVRE